MSLRNHRALAALAGASIGATTVLVAPAAYAAPAPDPSQDRTRPNPAPEAAEQRCNGSIRYELGNGEYELNPAFNGNPYCFLTPGDSGLPVTKVQDALAKCYGQDLGPAGVDGIYGDYTTRGVKNVQNFKNQSADGVYDGELFNAGFQFPVYDRNNNWTGRCTTV